MTDGLSEAHWNYLVGLWLIATIGMDTLCDPAPAGPWQSALTVHWTLNLDFVGGYLGYFLLGARLARLQSSPPGDAVGRDGGQLCRHRRRHLLAHQPHRRLRRAHQELSASLYRRAGCGPVPCWRAPMGRAGAAGGPSPPCPGCPSASTWVHPMAIQFWQKAWTAWITPAVDTIPLQLGYYLAILLSCLAGVALLMSVKPLCWLFTGQSFSSACRECNLFALFRRNPSKQTPAS